MLKANLWCPNCTCGARGKDQDFKIEVEKDNSKLLTTTKCPNDSKIILKHMGFTTTTIGTIDASKKNQGRSPKEREARRTGDFVKNILPTLGGDDRKHFERKFGVDKSGKKKK